jgi:hypothetical protein
MPIVLDHSGEPRKEDGQSMTFESLHTYFLFPFALDTAAIRQDRPQAWPGKTRWVDGLDSWIAGEGEKLDRQGVTELGPWKRATYTKFDIQSPAYADLLFFNPIVRHVFFDTDIGRSTDEQENQLRCYTMCLTPASRLLFEGTDAIGGSGRAEVKDLRLYLSAHGTGILSIGVSASMVGADQALWINRRLRKLYPVDADAVREGRTPNWLAFRLECDSQTETLCEERFEDPRMVGIYPPLPETIKRLLYFADYAEEQYEPVLDENMLVYSYGELDMKEAAMAECSPQAEFVEEFLFLRHMHTAATLYSTGSGTLLIGITNHNCSMLRLKSLHCIATDLRERLCGANHEVVRVDLDAAKVFHTRFYLMLVAACFYRAVLLDFSERCALVSLRLRQDQQAGRLSPASIAMVNDFRTEFLHFGGYWHFDELTCKQGDNDLFRHLCAQYRIDDMKAVLTAELGHMTEFVYNFYQLRTTEAVNRLAVLSLIFGGGAVLTGFFGMNFSREFEKFIFEGEGMSPALHYLLVLIVTGFVLGSLALGAFVVVRNWREYLSFLVTPKTSQSPTSLKRNP